MNCPEKCLSFQKNKKTFFKGATLDLRVINSIVYGWNPFSGLTTKKKSSLTIQGNSTSPVSIPPTIRFLLLCLPLRSGSQGQNRSQNKSKTEKQVYPYWCYSCPIECVLQGERGYTLILSNNFWTMGPIQGEGVEQYHERKSYNFG